MKVNFNNTHSLNKPISAPVSNERPIPHAPTNCDPSQLPSFIIIQTQSGKSITLRNLSYPSYLKEEDVKAYFLDVFNKLENDNLLDFQKGSIHLTATINYFSCTQNKQEIVNNQNIKQALIDRTNKLLNLSQSKDSIEATFSEISPLSKLPLIEHSNKYKGTCGAAAITWMLWEEENILKEMKKKAQKPSLSDAIYNLVKNARDCNGKIQKEIMEGFFDELKDLGYSDDQLLEASEHLFAALKTTSDSITCIENNPNLDIDLLQKELGNSIPKKIAIKDLANPIKESFEINGVTYVLKKQLLHAKNHWFVKIGDNIYDDLNMKACKSEYTIAVAIYEKVNIANQVDVEKNHQLILHPLAENYLKNINALPKQTHSIRPELKGFENPYPNTWSINKPKNSPLLILDKPRFLAIEDTPKSEKKKAKNQVSLNLIPLFASLMTIYHLIPNDPSLTSSLISGFSLQNQETNALITTSIQNAYDSRFHLQHPIHFIDILGFTPQHTPTLFSSMSDNMLAYSMDQNLYYFQDARSQLSHLFEFLPQNPSSQDLSHAISTNLINGNAELYCLDLNSYETDSPSYLFSSPAIDLYLLCAAIRAAFSVT